MAGSARRVAESERQLWIWRKLESGLYVTTLGGINHPLAKKRLLGAGETLLTDHPSPLLESSGRHIKSKGHDGIGGGVGAPL